MIRQTTTIERSRCDSCGGPNDNPDVAEITTFKIGPTSAQATMVRLCGPCIEHELLPVVAPWVGDRVVDVCSIWWTGTCEVHGDEWHHCARLIDHDGDHGCECGEDVVPATPCSCGFPDRHTNLPCNR